jgi:putative ABC transport system substrate-binding protein
VKRREFITLLGGAAAWPMVAHGQQLAMPLIGYLDPWSAEGHQSQLTAFRRGLNEVGFIESRNVMIEYHRIADIDQDRQPAHNSITTLRPSINPASAKPLRNAAT